MDARIDEETAQMLNECETVYRKHHPELDKIKLSRNKIIYEICKFYLKD